MNTMSDKITKIKTAMEAELEAFESVMDVSRFRELQKELETLVTTDKVTGVLNRWKFEEKLERQIKNHNEPFSIMMVDLDNFKEFNDTKGHMAGDALLYNFSKILKNSIGENDIVGRWGGDEFIVLCPSTNIYGCIETASQVKKNCNADNIELSIGLAEYELEDDCNKIINRADEAMYKAKNNGKNTIEK